jgi:hypothetical protein
MEDETRFGILARAETLPEWDRGQYIITETVKAVRAGDAQLSDEAIKGEFQRWCVQFSVQGRSLLLRQTSWVAAWTRHILTRGGLTD